MPIGKDILKFKCEDDFPTLEPEDKLQVYKQLSSTGAVKMALNQAINGATLDPSIPGGEHTLNVPKDNRPREDTTLIYYCWKKQSAESHSLRTVDEKPPAAAPHCKVTVTVSGTSPQSSAEQERPPPSEGENENHSSFPPNDIYRCAAGEPTETTVSEPNSEVKMKCADEFTFQPTETSEAFDGECASIKSLAELVPGAERKDGHGIHSLRIPSLPEGSESKALCYQCQPASNVEAKKDEKSCQFKIRVKPTAAADSSAGRGVSGHSTLFLAGAVVAAGFATASE
ncbi:SAG-related sequence [Besnoitia besnoiti]|uniref:SAG-related sequence n=1 Tax=Besnoitia besnoiti TaxID=94643 RepID=A0A2A9MNU0_BESBE|nr:SAG-related sequence [Besnoitia besnoiti]PFH37382.1 SAG-related sequence [Besnoitia besnoiti]